MAAESEFFNLAPMKVIDEPGPSTSATSEEPKSILKKSGTISANHKAIDQFVNNQITYEEFMELTGGMCLQDEGQMDKNNERLVSFQLDSDGDQEEEPASNFQPESEKHPLKVNPLSPKKRKLSQSPNHRLLADVELPVELRSQIRIDTTSGEFVMTQATQPFVDDEFDTPSFSGSSQRKRYRRHTNPALEALIGQANLIAAQGDKENALKMMHEVIRQEPRNPDVYRQIAQLYEEGDDEASMTKAFEYRLLGAHLYSRTSAMEWNEVGDLALRLNRLEEAAACYGRAIRAEPQNWSHYDRRIEVFETLMQRPLAMKTRFQAAQSVTNVEWEFIKTLIKMVADYYVKTNEEDKAMEVLHIFIIRAREFDEPAEEQRETHISMLIQRGRYEDAIRAILALVPGINPIDEHGLPVFKITYSTGSYTVKPFPPAKNIHQFMNAPSVPTSSLLKLTFCFIKIGRKDDIPTLVDEIIARSPLTDEDFDFYINIGRAYYDDESYNHSAAYAECLTKTEEFKHDPNTWLLYGMSKKALSDIYSESKPGEAARCIEIAVAAFERALELQPDLVDARLNLSTIVLNHGKAREALEILKDFKFQDIESSSHLPDERLLVNQAEILHRQGDVEQYIRCVKMLLLPYFHDVHLDLSNPKKMRRPNVAVMHNSLRKAAFDAVRGSHLEKCVKRLGSKPRAIKTIDGNHLHDYAFRLVEILFNKGRYQEMLQVVCYAYNQPKIISIKSPVYHNGPLLRNPRAFSNENFQNILFFSAIHGKNYTLAFEFLRYFYAHFHDKEERPEIKKARMTKIFNAMNFVLCHQQNISYHRFIMRALSKNPTSFPLHMISGNNSLVTGSYRHALGEYLHVLLANREDPLSCLLVGLVFTHMACKKDISGRHLLAIRSIGFMYRYKKLRGDVPQEIDYNIARNFHQLGMSTHALHAYKKVLEAPIPEVGVPDERTGDVNLVQAERYDLKRAAAHNMALIYEASGNRMLARKILEDYCTI